VSKKGASIFDFSDHALKRQNDDVVSTIRKMGLFRTNQQVIDAALRLLVFKLKEDYELAPKVDTTAEPEKQESLPSLPSFEGSSEG
jgi:hypothetical protein